MSDTYIQHAHPDPKRLATFEREDPALSTQDRAEISHHLQGCQDCRAELTALRSFDFSLIQRWKAEALQNPIQPKITHIVIQHLTTEAKRGLALVEQYVTEPIRSVIEVQTPQLALRGAEPGVTIQVHAEQVTIVGTVRHPSSDRFALTLKCMDADQTPVTHTPVEIRDQGRLIVGDETNAQGRLDVSSIALEPGTYTVTFPTLQTTFELELRARAEETTEP